MRIFALAVVMGSVFVTAQAVSQTVDVSAFRDRWAILVGVGAYPEVSDVPTLEHPSEDVLRLQKVLSTHGGIREPNITTLTNEQATHNGLEAAFQAIRPSVQAEDLVLFYFSGRGVRVPSGRYPDSEQDGLNECLLLYDSIRDVTDSFLWDAELGRLFRGLRADKRIIIIDACYTASDTRSKAIATMVDAGLDASVDGINSEFMPQGTAILEACAPTAETRDGVFTPMLVEALQDGTAHGTDGIITLQETEEFLRSALPNQQPQLTPEGGLLTATSLVQPLVMVDSQPSGAEVSVNGILLLAQNRSPATTPVTLTLPVGDYEVELERWGYQIPSRDSLQVKTPGWQQAIHLTLRPASIQGQLVHEESGEPIEGVTVKLATLDPEYETATDVQGIFRFNDWARYTIRPGGKYEVQIRDKKERVPSEEIPFELGVVFNTDRDIGTIRLKDLTRARRKGLLQSLAVVVVIVTSSIGMMVWVWKIRPARVSAYREQHYPRWQNEIAERLWTVGRAELDWISARHRLYVQSRYTREHPETRPMSDGSISYPERIATRIADFDRAWSAARANLVGDTSQQLEAFHEATGHITAIFCQALEFGQEAETAGLDRLHGHLVNAPTLRLKLPSTFPFIFVQCDTPTDKDLDAIPYLMRRLQISHRFAFVVVFSNSGPIQARLVDRALRPGYELIVLDEHCLRNILTADAPRESAIEAILSQVELTVIVPYVTSGATPPNVFFGREWEIKTILHGLPDSNIALVGGRRIGKTSILHRIRDILLRGQRVGEYDLTEQDLQLFPFYLSSEAASNYEVFLDYVAVDWDTNAPLDSLSDFSRLVSKERKAHGRPLAIFIDEIDGILQYDLEHGNQLFGMFRALTERDICRFVFTGERVFHRAMLNPNSPLFNFCQRFQIGYLDAKSASLLVYEPMKLVGIGLDDEESVIRRIVAVTSCHPRMIQWLCLELLKRINQKNTRTITLADIEEIENSRTFRDEYIMTILGQRGPLEELASLLIIEAGSPLSVGEIEEGLRANELEVPRSELQETLDILRLTSLLSEQGGRYQFMATELPRIFSVHRDVRACIEQLCKGIHHEQRKTV